MVNPRKTTQKIKYIVKMSLRELIYYSRKYSFNAKKMAVKEKQKKKDM